MRKIVLYTIDFEDISIEDVKGLISEDVFNRVSTNSIVHFGEIKEIEFMDYDDWNDDCKFNFTTVTDKDFEDEFKKHKVKKE